MAGGPVSRYASSRNALGMCDRCGWTWPLTALKVEIFDQRPNGLLVCPDCLDVDNPQLQLGRIPVDDPQSLYNPRPDLDKLPSTTYFGWAPIGNPITNYVTCEIGNVTVIIT